MSIVRGNVAPAQDNLFLRLDDRFKNPDAFLPVFLLLG